MYQKYYALHETKAIWRIRILIIVFQKSKRNNKKYKGAKAVPYNYVFVFILYFKSYMYKYINSKLNKRKIKQIQNLP